jgi:tripartite-type tricarboxylate transporter receptor subunit TctC
MMARDSKRAVLVQPQQPPGDDMMGPSVRSARALLMLCPFGMTMSALDVWGQSYPSKPARMIVAFGAGATTDIVARIFANKLSEVWGQQLVVENRPGAGGVIGLESAARATPDGYTLVLCGINQAISAALYKKLPYDHLRDFAPVSLVATLPNILVVNSAVPARTVGEFVAYAKANPGKMKYASSGIGASPHLTMELFKTTSGINLVHVPYKTMAQGVTDLLGGHVDAAFNNLPTQLPNVRAGKMRALGVTSARRSEQLPDVPTIIESGYPDFEVTVWQGLCAPARTPPEILTKLHADVMKALAAPDLRQRFVEQGVDSAPSSTEAFSAFIRAETVRWGKTVRESGVVAQ